MDYGTGDVIRSIAGHDKGKCFIVIATEGKFILAADGRTKTVDQPKLKNPKHVLKIGTIDSEDAKALVGRTGYFAVSAGTSDSRIRRLLRNTEKELL